MPNLMLFITTPNSEHGHHLDCKFTSRCTHIDHLPFAVLNIRAVGWRSSPPFRPRLTIHTPPSPFLRDWQQKLRAYGYAGLYSTSEELRAVSVPSEAGPLARSHQTKASREIKAKATSMSLLDPTYVIEVLPPWSGLRTRNVVALSLAAALCGAERSGGTWSRQANVGPRTPTYKREKTSVTNWRVREGR
ncbi:hypothetical protein FOIG_07848 [Fusarium odoratissimum NRRL 54006]|uniref:Uncharacterized protein n=2 Tax=Fusarium oxysporum species complex TaxID=171631 RepID=X0JX07_FUSO5|nr:uncharacterized protein FOIG_07848 [Fusarium odoratissimum NRRL 54006]EXM01002.1 hypothetical protein FOIG_07848 [Fusarium odoratissimum NRRL 54006]TXB98428.1 hypothetical protein FocTR4_00013092 [Fusarium oxysporum f. sp. cubense]